MTSASLDRRSEDVRVLPIVIAELELGDIERHIFAAHFVECADYATFEDRPEAFNGLSVDRTDNVLPFGMVNGSVREIFIEAPISCPLIGAKQADFMGNGFSDKCIERCSLDVRDHARNDVALAADSADDRRFAGTDAACSAAAAAFIPMPVFSQAADESFVNLNDPAEFIDIFHERGSDLVAHEPSGFIGTEAHITIELQSAHAFLADEHEMNDAIPLAQRLVRVLENRPGDVGKTVGNTISTVHTFPLESHGFELIDMPASATRATDAIRPSARNEICATRWFIWEQFFELCGRKLVNGLGLLTAGHGALLSLERSVS
jgi:hypothetical protein